MNIADLRRCAAKGMTTSHPLLTGGLVSVLLPASPQRGRNSLLAHQPGALFGGCE